MGLFYCAQDTVREIIEHQNNKTFLLDEQKLQDVVTHVFGVSKMFALFLRDDEDFGLDLKTKPPADSFEAQRCQTRMFIFD